MKSDRATAWHSAFDQLDQGLRIPAPSPLEVAGILQMAALCAELGWKIIRDHLADEGETLAGPAETLRLALKRRIIADEAAWRKCIQARNRISHAYTGSQSISLLNEIRDEFMPAYVEFKDWLNKQDV